MEGAVRDLKGIELLAGEWREALTDGGGGPKDGLPTLPTRGRGAGHPSPRADQAGPQPGPGPQPGDTLPAPAGSQAVDNLERPFHYTDRHGTPCRLPPGAGSTSSNAKSIVSSAPWREMGRGREPPGFRGAGRNTRDPPPPAVEGEVRKVDQQRGRVEIDIGSDDSLPGATSWTSTGAAETRNHVRRSITSAEFGSWARIRIKPSPR